MAWTCKSFSFLVTIQEIACNININQGFSWKRYSKGKRNLKDKLSGISLLVKHKYHHEAMKLLLLCAAPTVGYVQRCARSLPLQVVGG